MSKQALRNGGSFMKRLILAATALCVVAAASAVPATAGTQDNAVISLHVKSHAVKAIEVCTTANPNTNLVPCSQYVLTGGLSTALDAYLVVANAAAGAGIGGLSCGIEYNGNTGEGVGVFAWTLCADLEFKNSGPDGEWPQSHGGNRITFETTTNCQRVEIGGEGVHAVAGAFYVYAYGDDTFRVTPNRNLVNPELAVADCAASETQLDTTGTKSATAAFGAATGAFNPCQGVPVETTTWGKIKSAY